jgi:hypothetical protein
MLYGTHNSCTYGSLLNGCLFMVTPWVRNQSLTISEQLEKGVRWFDFRVSYEKGNLYLSHTYLMEHTLHSIMEEFDSYFKGKPDCPFIMINLRVDFNDRANQAVINPLVQEILSWYKSLCIERNTFDATVPLVENKTTCKILFYNSDATLSHPSIFPSDLMPTLYGWDTGSIEAFEERLLKIDEVYRNQTQSFIYPNERMIMFDYSSVAPLWYTDKQQLQLMLQYKSFIKNKNPTILSGNHIEDIMAIFRE